jgi:hypothetical protein
MTRFQLACGALVLTQAIHSVEEYAGRFAFVAFGVWAFLVPVRQRWPSAIPIAWFFRTPLLGNSCKAPG